MPRGFWILALLLASCGQQPEAPVTSEAETPTDPTWRYGENVDQMRGKKTYWSDVASSNQPNLEFPYEGGSPVTLTLQKVAGDTYPDNYPPRIVLENGQFDCSGSSYGNSCSVSMKVDDKPVAELMGVKVDCGADQCLILHSDPYHPIAEASVIAAVRGSNRVILEIPLYHFGSYQYEFNTAGLNWSVKTDRQ